MAFSRKFLAALGIEQDKIDEIVTAHMEVVEGLKGDLSKYKTEAEKLPAIQTELDALKAKGDDGYKAKYEEAKNALDALQATVAKNAQVEKKKTALMNLLKDAGISEKRIDTVAKTYNLDDFEIDENGKAADYDAKKTAMQTEWADFIATTETKGANTATPPANNPTTKDLFEQGFDEG